MANDQSNLNDETGDGGAVGEEWGKAVVGGLDLVGIEVPFAEGGGEG